MGRLEYLNRFYELLGELEDRLGGRRGGMGWPRRGVYFFFGPGERREAQEREVT